VPRAWSWTGPGELGQGTASCAGSPASGSTVRRAECERGERRGLGELGREEQGLGQSTYREGGEGKRLRGRRRGADGSFNRPLMAPVITLIEGGYEGERKGNRSQFQAREGGEGTWGRLGWGREVDSAGWGRARRRCEAQREVEETPDGWVPSGGEREGEGCQLGRFGLGFQFFCFPSSLKI
jgi:hypothetical protein